MVIPEHLRGIYFFLDKKKKLAQDGRFNECLKVRLTLVESKVIDEGF